MGRISRQASGSFVSCESWPDKAEIISVEEFQISGCSRGFLKVLAEVVVTVFMKGCWHWFACIGYLTLFNTVLLVP